MTLAAAPRKPAQAYKGLPLPEVPAQEVRAPEARAPETHEVIPFRKAAGVVRVKTEKQIGHQVQRLAFETYQETTTRSRLHNIDRPITASSRARIFAVLEKAVEAKIPGAETARDKANSVLAYQANDARIKAGESLYPAPRDANAELLAQHLALVAKQRARLTAN